MKVNPYIFREYDIRGVAGKNFTDKSLAEYEKWYGPFPGITINLAVAEAIGKAYGTIIRREGGKKVLVGREIRPFAQELTESFVKGIRSTGCGVVDAGETITPMVYFGIAYFNFDGGVNVTGSHNVYFFNGFKITRKKVVPIFGEELQKMKEIIEQDNFEKAEEGSYGQIEILSAYRQYLLEHIKLERPLKIVLDCGNGSTGLVAPKLFRDFGCEVIEMYTLPDATFPNHVPDPEDPYNMRELSERVIAEKADCGIGLDADGDRVGFIDEKGEYVDADKLILIIAIDALLRNPGKKILFDVKCSRLLQDMIVAHGGIPLMHRTGHAPIKDSLQKDSEIIFAGEKSGHLFFVENYFKFDDGIFGALKILSLASKIKGSFSGLFRDIPQTVRTTELKLPCDDAKKFEIVNALEGYFSEKYETIKIDGVRVIFDKTSWGLVRASNTSPYLTIRFEADTKERLLELKNIFADQLEKFPEIMDKIDRQNVASHTGRLGWV